jgi:hypothetical protein
MYSRAFSQKYILLFTLQIHRDEEYAQCNLVTLIFCYIKCTTHKTDTVCGVGSNSKRHVIIVYGIAFECKWHTVALSPNNYIIGIIQASIGLELSISF